MFLPVTRTARIATLGDDIANPSEVWIACHGYGQLAARFIRHFEPLLDGTRRIYAPEALSRFYFDPPSKHRNPDSRIGATWMTREDREHEIADYVGYLDALVRAVAVPGARLVAFGFSQGVSTVMRWAALGSARVDRVIAWSGSFPPDLDLAQYRDRFGRVPLDYVSGDADEFFDEAAVRAQCDRLRDAGVAFTFTSFPGRHTIDRETLLRIAVRG